MKPLVPRLLLQGAARWPLLPGLGVLEVHMKGLCVHGLAIGTSWDHLWHTGMDQAQPSPTVTFPQVLVAEKTGVMVVMVAITGAHQMFVENKNLSKATEPCQQVLGSRGPCPSPAGTLWGKGGDTAALWSHSVRVTTLCDDTCPVLMVLILQRGKRSPERDVTCPKPHSS